MLSSLFVGVYWVAGSDVEGSNTWDPTWHTEEKGEGLESWGFWGPLTLVGILSFETLKAIYLCMCKIIHSHSLSLQCLLHYDNDLLAPVLWFCLQLHQFSLALISKLQQRGSTSFSWSPLWPVLIRRWGSTRSFQSLIACLFSYMAFFTLLIRFCTIRS